MAIDACNDIYGIIIPADDVGGVIDNVEELQGEVNDAQCVQGGINPVGEAVGVVAIPKDIIAKVGQDVYFQAELSGEPTLSAVVNIGHCGDAVPYEGEYTVTPKIEQQILPTDHKYMLEDVTVKAIPYYETSNPKGTTVYIGSEV